MESHLPKAPFVNKGLFTHKSIIDFEIDINFISSMQLIITN